MGAVLHHHGVWNCRSALAGPSRYALMAVLATTFLASVLTVRADKVTYQDVKGDARPRRTDVEADGPIGQALHQLPDLVSVAIGSWKPSSPQLDLFTGTWSNMGDFVRLELVFEGVMNPPGPLGCCGAPSFEPFRYGPNPISGYIEIDVDRDINSGGELDWPNLRYLGNTSRFGGVPLDSTVAGRVAIDIRNLDGNIETAPFVERSGEDFHLELVGWEIESNQIQRSDSSDWLFGPGETWVITGNLLHRAHGYSRFCSSCCRTGVPIGDYEPLVKVQFAHQVQSNRTTITLVYPLSQQGAASMTGASIEPMDIFYTNQNSIAEALWEMKISAMSASYIDRQLPEFVLIAPWENKNPDAYLDPSQWQIRLVVGGSYTSPQDSLFVWSDIFPDVTIGDFDGNGVANSLDLVLLNTYLQNNDGVSTVDADGVVNGSIEILNFGPGFSLYDLNYDGLVDSDDQAMVGGPLLSRADFDRDGDVDQTDFGHLQLCLSGSEMIKPGCRNADYNRDGSIDQADVAVFVECAAGPVTPADPACGRP